MLYAIAPQATAAAGRVRAASGSRGPARTTGVGERRRRAMVTYPGTYLLQGPFNFLRPNPDEINALLPEVARWLPQPGVSYLDEETATPVRGFPILISDAFRELVAALDGFIAAEEEVQMAVFLRRPPVRAAHAAAWDRYRELIAKAVENVTISSYGRNFPSIFWLQHSLDVARLVKETPRRVLRIDLAVGREQGDTIKYRVLERYLERVLTTTYDLVSRLAEDTDDVEEELFPRLLSRMRDNVLIFSEDHISHNLAELTSYFHGYLRLDGRDFLRRVQLLGEWNLHLLETDRGLRDAVRHLFAAAPPANPATAPDPASRARELLNRPGWVRFLASRPDYPEQRLLSPQLLRVWEGLLVRLKEFEIFQGLRRYLMPVHREGDRLVGRGGAVRALGGRSELRLSAATRPLDFMAPWVVEPQVQRFGLIYDLSDFSEIISVLRRSGTDDQDDSFRKMFRFQRRLNGLAAARRMKLEKYLGDGAFYSSRRSVHILAGGIEIQRAYRLAVAEGFPFDRGIRIALNHGQYRLIPIDGGRPGDPERYEFFGHGLVELSRLITGKATRELEEIKTMLVAQGYPEPTVYRFFAPLLRSKQDVGEPRAEERRFRALINASGNLVNEGIVATEAFIAHLDGELRRSADLFRGRDGDSAYVVVRVKEADGLLVGLRKLGLAHLKGLDQVPIFEVVDGAPWEGRALPAATGDSLAAAIEREFVESQRVGVAR